MRAREPSRIQPYKNMEDPRHSSADALLASLSDWERRYGRYAGKELASTGESNARIDDLRRQLAEMGVVFCWNGERFVEVKRRPAGEGGEVASGGGQT